MKTTTLKTYFTSVLFAFLFLVSSSVQGIEARDLSQISEDDRAVVELIFLAYGFTPLMIDSLMGNTDSVKEHLQRGANVNERTEQGVTALMAASLMGRAEIVEVLINHGASVNEQDEEGYTALTMAALAGHTDIAMLLVRAGAR